MSTKKVGPKAATRKRNKNAKGRTNAKGPEAPKSGKGRGTRARLGRHARPCCRPGGHGCLMAG